VSGFSLTNLVIHAHRGWAPGEQPVEVVERKGLGHPDTLCDAVSERICVRLCRYYLDRFGVILHHNVDKVLLCGGSSRAIFGGGEILEPMEFYLAGRATRRWRGEQIPVDEIAAEACKEVLREALPGLDTSRDVRITPRIGHGSTDLTRLFERGSGTALANDTSCGAGFAPATALERIVLGVAQRLNSAGTHEAYPAIGSDVKVMGVRVDQRVTLTIGCAMIARRVAGMNEYASVKDSARALALNVAREIADLEVTAILNAADDIAAGDVFLTVSGTSAEAGDDGETGRGNRVNGLICPYRSMTMEAAAGKNPITHVGKLYNVIAGRISSDLVSQIEGIHSCTCRMVSQIGGSIDDPHVVDIELGMAKGVHADNVRVKVGQVVAEHLERISELRDELLQQRITVF
jgi:S-adenosylmethionine synthetase